MCSGIQQFGWTKLTISGQISWILSIWYRSYDMRYYSNVKMTKMTVFEVYGDYIYIAPSFIYYSYFYQQVFQICIKDS